MALGLLVSEILHFCCRFISLLTGHLRPNYYFHNSTCWYNIFLMTIISFEDSIPQCDFKLTEICYVIENVCLTDRTLFVTLSSVIWDINF